MMEAYSPVAGLSRNSDASTCENPTIELRGVRTSVRHMLDKFGLHAAGLLGLLLGFEKLFAADPQMLVLGQHPSLRRP